MKNSAPRVPAPWSLLSNRYLHFAVLVALPFAIYSNNYRHAYLLDDGYTLVNNPHVRSLAEIPSYFVDPSTYTSLREQVDYRPLLQVTYALNYAMGGYDIWWWHFTQILLHVLTGLGIYALCRRIITLSGETAPDWIPLLAAIVFAIHPGASGVVNYLNARSSLLTAVFVLPALIAYMKPIEEDGYARPAWTTAAFFTLALFTKVEAVGALGAFLAYELWQRGRELGPAASFGSALKRALDKRTLRRMAPALAVTIIYFIIRRSLLAGYPFGSARHAVDVGPYEYFLTEVTAWWYYVLRWIAPVRLIADYSTYPVYRSWSDPIVVLAVGGWVVVVGLLAAAWRRAPYVVFLVLAALALLSPTSSVAPLSEMVNEHRPYLPIGILSLGLFISAAQLARQNWWRSARVWIAAGLALVLVSFSALTWRRNRVFTTDASYWQDVLSKAPSARAHVNYGLTLLGANDLQGALGHFRQSLELAPYWYIGHLNLAAADERLAQTDSARDHYDRAIQYDKYSGMSFTWRGEFRARQGNFEGAVQDFMSSLPVSLERYRNVRGLATAYAGLGDVPHSLEQTGLMLQMDSAAALNDIPGVSNPFFERPERYAAGIDYYTRLSTRLSGVWWVYENLARLATLAGDKTRATEAHGLALKLNAGKPETSPEQQVSQEALMKDGLDLLYTRNNPAAAAAKFREVLAGNPAHYGAHFQLAVALDRSGKPDEARPIWQEMLRLAEAINDQQTAQTARERLQRRR